MQSGISASAPDVFVKHLPLGGLSRAAMRRVVGEYEILARIDHPNIVRIRRVEAAYGASRIALIMDSAPGRELDRYFREVRCAGPAIERALTQMFGALEYLHARGISHGDLRPANVLCDGAPESAHVTLVDFGAARQADPDFGLLDFDRRVESDLAQLRACFRASVPDALSPKFDSKLQSLSRAHAARFSAGADRLVPKLMGRESILAEIERAIAACSRKSFRFVLLGPKGSGKSRLLREVRARAARHFVEAVDVSDAAPRDVATPRVFLMDGFNRDPLEEARRGVFVAAVDPFALGARERESFRRWAKKARVLPLRDLRESELAAALERPSPDLEALHAASGGNPGAALMLSESPDSSTLNSEWRAYARRLSRQMPEGEQAARMASALTGDRLPWGVRAGLSEPPAALFPSVGHLLLAARSASEQRAFRESLLEKIQRRPQALGGRAADVLVPLLASLGRWGQAYPMAHRAAQKAIRNGNYEAAWRIAAPCLSGPMNEARPAVLRDAVTASWRTGRFILGLKAANELARLAPGAELELFRARLLRELGRYASAERAARRGLALTDHERSLRSELLAEWAFVLQLQQKPRRARDVLARALDAVPEKENGAAAAHAMVAVTSYRAQFSEPLGALRSSTLALKHARSAGDRAAEARIRQHMAISQRRLGRFEMAYGHARIARRFFRRTEDIPRDARASLLLGHIDRERGRFEVAARIFRDAQRTLTGQSVAATELNAGLGLAETFVAGGHYARAELLLKPLANRAEKGGLAALAAAIESIRTFVEDRLGHFRNAEETLRRAESFGRGCKREDILAWICRAQGQIRHHRGDAAGAAEAFAEGARRARSAGDAPMAVELDLRRALAIALGPKARRNYGEIERLIRGGLRSDIGRLRVMAEFLLCWGLKQSSRAAARGRSLLKRFCWSEWRIEALKLWAASGQEPDEALDAVLIAAGETVDSGDVMGQIDLWRAASDAEFGRGQRARAGEFATRALDLIRGSVEMKHREEELSLRVGQAATAGRAESAGPLAALDQALATDTRSSVRLLDRVLDAALESFHADAAYLLLYSASERFAVPHARSQGGHAIRRAHLEVSKTIARDVRRSGRAECLSDTLTDPRALSIGSLRARGVRSVLAVPFTAPGFEMGVLILESRTTAGLFCPAQIPELDAYARRAAIALRLRRSESRSSGSKTDRTAAKTRKRAGRPRRGEFSASAPVLEFGTMAAESESMLKLFDQIRKVAPTDLGVLITGESGTGKELVAGALHKESARRSGPFVTINCGAIAASLLESELFGHARGAFTGAVDEKQGLFESAAGGTIFLDEITETEPAFQVGLLRVLQHKQIRRVGDVRTRDVDVRVIAATNADIEERVANGRFRRDLFYRLSHVQLRVPPLRERLEDLPLLAAHILSDASGKKRLPPKPIDPDVLDVLRAHSWPGNVRELENVLEHALAMTADRITAERVRGILGHRASTIAALPAVMGVRSLQETVGAAERAAVAEALRVTRNRTEAAERLGIDRAWLYRLMRRYGLRDSKSGRKV